MHQRLDVHEARARVDPPHRVDAGQRGAHQAALDVVAAVPLVAPRSSGSPRYGCMMFVSDTVQATKPISLTGV